jgi:hypothetical protein
MKKIIYLLLIFTVLTVCCKRQAECIVTFQGKEIAITVFKFKKDVSFKEVLSELSKKGFRPALKIELLSLKDEYCSIYSDNYQNGLCASILALDTLCLDAVIYDSKLYKFPCLILSKSYKGYEILTEESYLRFETGEISDNIPYNLFTPYCAFAAVKNN